MSTISVLYARLRLIATPRRILICTAALLATGTLISLTGRQTLPMTLVRGPLLQPDADAGLTLGISHGIYVISLPRRTDRRARMETLRRALNLQWTYVDALEGTDELTRTIWEWVLRVRTGEPTVLDGVELSQISNLPSDGVSFSWPSNIDQLAHATAQIDIWSEAIWSTPTAISNSTVYHPIACATQDYNISDTTVGLPGHLILTRARIACWHSHLSVIHNIANNADTTMERAYVILEDDIDMEKDIVDRLNALWGSLPQEWDIVFLGHCWADETEHSPLPLRFPTATSMKSDKPLEATTSSPVINRLYPSRCPKCTHAYVLSKKGARRLLLHLRYPPFAYSRAIDQAFSWLIESGRLKAYTVVPNLVIQRKEDDSDILSGTGSKWKVFLTNGVLSGKHVIQPV